MFQLLFSRIISYIRDEVTKKHALGEAAAEHGLPWAGSILGRMPMQCQHTWPPVPASDISPLSEISVKMVKEKG